MCWYNIFTAHFKYYECKEISYILLRKSSLLDQQRHHYSNLVTRYLPFALILKLSFQQPFSKQHLVYLLNPRDSPFLVHVLLFNIIFFLNREQFISNQPVWEQRLWGHLNSRTLVGFHWGISPISFLFCFFVFFLF